MKFTNGWIITNSELYNISQIALVKKGFIKEKELYLYINGNLDKGFTIKCYNKEERDNLFREIIEYIVKNNNLELV